MRTLSFAEAIEDALAQAMAADPRVLILGEDVHTLRRNLYVRFGQERVRTTPISEAAFLGASVTAAMGGLRPIVEIMLIDFIGVAMDALLNHAAKNEAFSGGKWPVPLVVRSACGGGYGDGGQHEQSLWGWLAHIPGLSVVVPSNPEDAGRLMLAALEHPSPVIYLEHKLLSGYWLEHLGGGKRNNVHFDIPSAGARGPVPSHWTALPLGHAAICREGRDITLVSIGIGVHRALEAAQAMAQRNISAGVVDLRSVAPLDRETICRLGAQTGRMLVIDEDYESFGLSGELAAILLEAGLQIRYGRVCTRQTIPYARTLEDQVLPSTKNIIEAAIRILEI